MQILYQNKNGYYSAKYGKKQFRSVSKNVYPFICNSTNKQYQTLYRSPVDEQIENEKKRSSLPCGLGMNLRSPDESDSTPAVCRTVTYTFQNRQYTYASGDTFLEFDIYANQNTPGLLYKNGEIDLRYLHTGIFNTSGGGILTMGSIASGLTYNYQATDTTFDSLPGLRLAFRATTDTTLFAVGLIAQQFCHIKLKYMPGVSGTTITFDSLAMQTKSEYYDILNDTHKQYDLVNAGKPLAMLGEGECAEDAPKIQYGITLPANPIFVLNNQGLVSINIVATSNVSDIDNGDIDVDYVSGSIFLNVGNAFVGTTPVVSYLTGGLNSADYTVTPYLNGSVLELDIENTSGTSTGTLPYGAQILLFQVGLFFSPCVGYTSAGISFNTSTNANSNGTYFFSYDYEDGGNYPYCGVTNDGSEQNANICSCSSPGTDISFTFSNISTTYGSSPPGPDQGSLHYTVNFVPTSTDETSGSLYSSIIYIDYNTVGFGGDITADPVFTASGIVLSPELVVAGTIKTVTGSVTGSVGLIKIELSPGPQQIPFSFAGTGPIPLFTVNMPFDNSASGSNNCNVPCNVTFDPVMTSSDNNPVQTNFENSNFSNPTLFCSETTVDNDVLQNTYLCPAPEIDYITAGINQDQCPSAGSFVPVQIHGSHFLNGYSGIGQLKFIDADYGDYSNLYNSLTAPQALITEPIDIISWSDNLIELLLPAADGGGTPTPPGTGPFMIIAPGTLLENSLTGDNIYIEYALRNFRASNDGALCMQYLTSTQTASTNNPYTTFPLYTFDVNTNFFNNGPPINTNGGDAITVLDECLTNIQCTIGAPFFLDPNFNTNVVNNQTASASDGINEILMVPRTNPIWAQTAADDDPDGSTTLAVTILSGYYNVQCGTPNSTNPYGAISSFVTDLDIYFVEDPTLPWMYGATGTAYHFSNLQQAINHELGHCMMLGHSNHNLAHSDITTRIMYYVENWNGTVFYNDFDDARGAIKTLQWPTNADNENLNGITLAAAIGCTAAATPAVENQTGGFCTPNKKPGSCQYTGGVEGIPNITNESKDFNMQIYPNPSENNPVLHVDVYEKADFKIRIFDIIGNLIGETDLSGELPFSTTLDMGTVSAGVYIVTVLRSQDSFSRSVKFIKTN